MKKLLCSLLILSIFCLSCSKSINNGLPIIKSNKLVLNPLDKDKQSVFWGDYERDFIFWSTNYTALDASKNKISKQEFLKELTTGNFVPIKVSTEDSTLSYQLLKLNNPDTKNKELSSLVKTEAVTQLHFWEMEGKPLPKFNFTDLNGRVYNTENTKGKLVVVKCWFIGCTNCIKEMPMLNKLVKKFENKDDIVFLSLAYDSADDLKKFLTRKTFDYSIASVPNSFFSDDLGVYAYPTHIIIDRNGLVQNVTTDGKNIVTHLGKDKNGASEIINNSEKMLIAKRIMNMGSMPPPPPPSLMK